MFTIRWLHCPIWLGWSWLVIRTRLCIARLHSFLSFVISTGILISFKSSLISVLHFFFCPPSLVLPFTSISVQRLVHPVLRCTWPNHRSLFSRHVSVMSGIFKRSRRISDRTLSFNLTPQIHLIIARSVFCSLHVSFTVRPMHSVACNMALRTHVLYSLPRVGRDIERHFKMGSRSWNLPQATRVLFVMLLEQPPPALTVSPR